MAQKLHTKDIGRLLLPKLPPLVSIDKIDKRRSRLKEKKINGNGFGPTLSELAQRNLLPTPTISGSETYATKSKREGHEMALSTLDSMMDYIRTHGMIPTPQATDYKGGATVESYKKRGRGSSNDLRTWVAFQEDSGKTSQLNPRFVLEMMGFPPNWTELPFQVGQIIRSKQQETQ